MENQRCMVDETQSFAVMFMSALEALAGVSAISITDVLNAQTYNVYPNGEAALVQVGAGNLKIDIGVGNLGADGTLYLKLTRDDSAVLEDSEKAVASGAVGTWSIVTDMPARNVSFTLEVGHVVGGGNGGVTHTLTIETFEYGGTGYTEPPVGQVVMAEGSVLQVYAYPTYGSFYGWNLDGVDRNENPITITFNSNHVLTAIFVG